jgi:hypothetical protein
MKIGGRMPTTANRVNKTRGRSGTTPKPRHGALTAKRRSTPAPTAKRRITTASATEVAAGQSVIKRKYRERYENGSCGDSLARKLKASRRKDLSISDAVLRGETATS